jgi:hypothetical protein
MTATLEPSQRFAFDEEAVEVWREAGDKLGTLATIGYGSDFFGNPGVSQALADAEERAWEAFRRAKQRARGAG